MQNRIDASASCSTVDQLTTSPPPTRCSKGTAQQKEERRARDRKRGRDVVACSCRIGDMAVRSTSYDSNEVPSRVRLQRAVVYVASTVFLISACGDSSGGGASDVDSITKTADRSRDAARTGLIVACDVSKNGVGKAMQWIVAQVTTVACSQSRCAPVGASRLTFQRFREARRLRRSAQ